LKLLLWFVRCSGKMNFEVDIKTGSVFFV